MADQILKDAIIYVLIDRRGTWTARKELLRLLAVYGQRTDERIMRDAIQELRRERNLIVSRGGANGGYKIADSLAEVQLYLEYQVEPKAMWYLAEKRIMRREAMRQFGPQMPLPLAGR